MAFLHFPDLDSITLDDLSLGSTVPVMGDPALIIREYLHPGQQHAGQNMQGRDHRLKVIASSIHTRWCWTWLFFSDFGATRGDGESIGDQAHQHWVLLQAQVAFYEKGWPYQLYDDHLKGFWKMDFDKTKNRKVRTCLRINGLWEEVWPILGEGGLWQN